MAIDPNGLFTVPSINMLLTTADAGAPTGLLTGQVVFNHADQKLYVGVGDTVGAAATSIVEYGGGGGGGDPWTRTVLASDYNNATTTFTTITDGTTPLTYTPTVGTYFTLEATLLIWTTTAANLPRIGLSSTAWGAGSYVATRMMQVGASRTTAPVYVSDTWTDVVTTWNSQFAAGGVASVNAPWLCEVVIRGKCVTSAGTISLQMACETAAASTCYVKAGSEMRYRETTI